MKLKKHQEFVVKYMKKKDPRGIILFHGLGSGKTISSIAISELYNKKVLVISPASMRTQWNNELKKMNVNLKKYQIISYEGFFNKIKYTSNKSLNNYIVIVDEAHRIRSPSGKISILIVKLLQTAFKVILLTGTPMVNGPYDMSSLLNAVKGENILPILENEFNERFYIFKNQKIPSIKNRCVIFSYIQCSNDGLKYKNNLCKYHNYLKYDYNNNPDKDYEKIQEDRILKATEKSRGETLIPNVSEYEKYVKNMVSFYKPVEIIEDFPIVNTKIAKVKMSDDQYKYYKKYSKKAQKQFNNIKSQTNIKTLNSFLNITRQISNTWKGEIDTPKLQGIVKIIEQYPKPAIVYSNWLKNGIFPLSEMLSKKKIIHSVFIGNMNDKQKKNVVDNYNNGKIDALLLSSSGGEGLDLKNTRQIHIMEPHWNNAKIKQVIGRGIRYKSHISLPINERNVTVFYWISIPLNNKLGTDEHLYDISEKKTQEMKLFLEAIKKNSIENIL
jgi:SNF2 family DNA or RNA helicase